MKVKRRIGLLRKTFTSEETRIGYMPVNIMPYEARIADPPSYSWGIALKTKELDQDGPSLRAYRNLASARIKGPKETMVIAEVLISGAFDEYEDGFIFQEYRLLQLVVTHCELCNRQAEFYIQENLNHSGVVFFCATHSSLARGIRPAADVVAFFNPEEHSFDVRRLNKIGMVPVVASLGVPFTSALGPYRWVSTRPNHLPQGEQKIAAESHFETIKGASKETRYGHDDGTIEATAPKELPATMKPLLDPSEELFKLREQYAVDRKRMDKMLKALRWKEEIIKKREEELRSLGVRIDEGEKSWQEGKGET